MNYMKITEVKCKEMSAGEIAKKALTILNFDYDCECWRNNNITVKGRKFTGRKGVSDIIGFQRKTGKVLFAEVKAKGDKFSADQIELLTNIHNNGGLALQATQEGLIVVVKPFIK